MGIKSFQQPLVGSILVNRFLNLGQKFHHFDDSAALSFDKTACSEACAIPILVKPINREIYYKDIGTAMQSSSLAKLAARPRTVSLPPAKPSIKNRDSDAVPFARRARCAVTCRDLAAGCAVD